MPLPRITIRGLKALLAVYEEQSFSRAAERENATQSGMSTQVRKLEDALGTPLLERGRGTLDLTPAGQLVYDRGRGILRELFALEKDVASLDHDMPGTIRCGVIPTLTRAVLPKAITTYRAAFPRVEVTVVEEYSHALMQRVLTGDLDFAAVPAGDILNGLSARHLASDRELLVVAPDMLPAVPHGAPVRPEQLDGLRMILPTPINVRRRGLDSYLDSHGVTLAERIGMDAMLGTLEMIATGGWSAILPAALCLPDIDGTTRKLHPLTAPDLHLEYVIVQKAERALGDAAGDFIEILGQAADQMTATWSGAP